MPGLTHRNAYPPYNSFTCFLQRICFTALTALLVFGCTEASHAQTAAEQYGKAEAIAKQDLAKFDTLDFDVFSNQKWDRLKESHAPDITVYWPDGHVEKGLDQHIESLKKLFVFAPDTRIKQHPVRIGNGEWTSVIGVMQGTFTKPMTMPNGKVVQPTGKSFTLPMCTVGHWKNGVMDTEYLFWDSATYYKQMGVE